MDSKPSCLLRGTTLAVCSLRPSLRAISIHMPLAGHDDGGDYLVSDPALISIHMPLAGHDGVHLFEARDRHISIHMPLAGHDLFGVLRHPAPERHFNPHAPCGARQAIRAALSVTSAYFNPHAPCGARLKHHPDAVHKALFQSTCPLRGTTDTIRARGMRPQEFQSACPLRGTTKS